jgi:hypothetical protein
MKFTIALVTVMLGAVTAAPAEQPGFTPYIRSVDPLTKRACSNGGLCGSPGERLCRCNQGKRVSARSLSTVVRTVLIIAC